MLQPARPGGVPQPRPPRTSANDTVNTGGNPGAALASASCQMLTVSSRTKTDIDSRTRIGTLTPDDASPLPRAQKNGAEHTSVSKATIARPGASELGWAGHRPKTGVGL